MCFSIVLLESAVHSKDIQDAFLSCCLKTRLAMKGYKADPSPILSLYLHSSNIGSKNHQKVLKCSGCRYKFDKMCFS